MYTLLRGFFYVVAALFILFLFKGFMGFIVDLWPVIKVAVIVGAIAIAVKWVGEQFTFSEAADDAAEEEDAD